MSKPTVPILPRPKRLRRTMEEQRAIWAAEEEAERLRVIRNDRLALAHAHHRVQSIIVRIANMRYDNVIWGDSNPLGCPFCKGYQFHEKDCLVLEAAQLLTDWEAVAAEDAAEEKAKAAAAAETETSDV